MIMLLVGCTARLPRPGEIGINVKVTGRIDARANIQPPPPPAPIVAIENAPVPEFFGIPLDNVQDVVFVLDCSGSMAEPAQGRLAQITAAPTTPPPPPMPEVQPPPPPPDQQPPPQPPPMHPRKIDVARAELIDALSRLSPGTRLNVIFFNSDLDAYAPQVVALQEPDRAVLITFVRESEPEGSTALAPAMRAAFMMNARRIVLLSDGLGNVGGGVASVLQDAREAMRGGVRIDTVGLGFAQNDRLLATLAGESGGLYQSL
jgi:hypothetical protein